ncbi:MAG: alanyl-tRNA editing protein, partial [Candidatus Zixiibacteriota bacterium]
MTRRLYYSDPDLVEFDAVITSTGNHEDLCYTQLDQSAFYPTSGGQLHDTGRLNNTEVVDVIERPDGEVWHLSRHPVGEAGAAVHGTIDRERRRRHQQQHTAQHILSHTLVKLFDFATVSVHLGEDYGTIEIDAGAITPEQLTELQTHARRIVDENVAVEILTVDADEIDTVPLRRETRRSGPIRVIKVGELDWSACGGTHCRSTAEVGLIRITGAEKIRGHALIKFLAGRQVASDYDMRFDVT